MRAPRRRRRLAAGLIAYGVVGLLLVAVGVPLIVGPLASVARIAGQQGEAVRWLDLTSQGLVDAGRGSSNAGASLASAANAARNAASLAQELAASMAALRDASGQTILGLQPLGGLTGEFDRVASRASDMAASMQSLAGMLDRDTTDFASIAGDASSLRGQVDQLRATVASEVGGAGTGTWLVPAAILLLLWLATPALVSLVAGIWLLQTVRARTARARPAEPAPPAEHAP